LSAFNFQELVTRSVKKKLEEAKKDQHKVMEEKLHRINGFVQRRIVHDYPYTDDFIVGNVIGEGGSGKVYHGKLRADARWTSAQRDVVLKTLSKKNISDEKLQDLVAETEVGLILDHPSVCRLLRVYESVSDVTLVLEYCSGGDLYERFAELGKYPEPMAQITCVQMLTALKYLQSQHVVHRDIKLENWLYVNKEESSPLCIADFGFAAYYNSAVDKPMTKDWGSPHYVAPEVLKKSYGHKCDMWSTGVVAFTLIYGMPPFHGADEGEIIRNVMFKSSKFPAFHRVSEEAEDFLRFVLNRNVAKRPGPNKALDHPWLAKANKATRSSEKIRRDSVDSLVAFADQPQLRRAALVVMSGGASNKTFRDARGAFLDLDLNGSGTITLQDFEKHLFERDHKLDKVFIQETFKKLDVHMNGEIHYSEFLAAYDHIALARNDEAISRAFDVFDSDKSGFITKENLREIFRNHLSEAEDMLEFERMLEDAGCSDSRGMDQRDFAMMVKNPRPVDHFLTPNTPKLNTWIQVDATPDDKRLSVRTASTASTLDVPSEQNASGHPRSLTCLVPRSPALRPDSMSRMILGQAVFATNDLGTHSFDSMSDTTASSY
jgi:calcium-dependent protein kinase